MFQQVIPTVTNIYVVVYYFYLHALRHNAMFGTMNSCEQTNEKKKLETLLMNRKLLSIFDATLFFYELLFELHRHET